MVKFSEIINTSFEWTITVLFRPFKLKKWLILGFVALMAGYMTSGNLNIGGNSNKKDKNQETKITEESIPPSSNSTGSIEQQQAEKQPSASIKGIFNKIFPKIKNQKIAVIILIPIAAFVLFFTIIMMWLCSCFSFIFLEDVVKNDASIKIPFRTNKEIGNSLFLFYLIFGAIFLSSLGLFIFMCFHTLLKLGAFEKTAAIGFKVIFLTCLPYGLVLLFIIAAALIIHLITNDFILVAMFKDRIKIKQAWHKIIAIIRVNKLDFIKYVFMKMGLTICFLIISGLLVLACLLGILFLAAIIGVIFYFIRSFIPAALRTPYWIILSIFIIPLVLFLFYCFLCLNLPFAVFFRTLSIKFIGNLEPRYNLFRPLK